MIGIKVGGGCNLKMIDATFINMETAILADDSTITLQNVKALGTKRVVKGTGVQINAQGVFHDDKTLNFHITPLAVFIRMHAHGHV